MIGQLLGCRFSCRSLIKILVVKRKVFRKSPDDRPFRLYIGSKQGGVMELERYSTLGAVMKGRALVLDWFDGEDGKACYQEALKMLLGGIVLNDGPLSDEKG